MSIIIVNYNGREYLKSCLASVLRQDYNPFEVLLIDNASTDGSVEYVNRQFPDVRVVEAQSNLGFAGGNNLGVRYAQGDFIVFLNNDTVVEEGWLQGLVDAVVPERVAAASSLIQTEDIPGKYYEKNGTINFVGHNIMRAFNKPTDIFFAGGASLIYKKNLLGMPFDEDYFAYAEDVYLSFRARFLGYEVRHSNESCVRHLGGVTARKQSSSLLTFYQERNRLLNMLLFFSPWTLMRLIPFFAGNVVVKIIYSLFSKRFSLLGILQSYVWLIAHILTIIRKRFILAQEKRVPDAQVLRFMSSKITNSEHILAKSVNFCSLSYCWLVGLKTIEFRDSQT